MMMRILCTVGARPNFMKMAPLYEEMRTRSGVEPFLVHTGQHYDNAMSAAFFSDLGLPAPDVNLNVSGGSHTHQTAKIMLRFEPVLEEVSPHVVVVVGDVNSTLAVSLVAAKSRIPLAHVEAGLRSGDRDMPEELNRILVDQLSDSLFVTEQSGVDNLLKEGIPRERIHLVGNVMIDTLLKNLERAERSDILENLSVSKEDYGLVTLHRPASSDDREVLGDILRALAEISQDLKMVFPVHPRTRKRIAEFGLLPLLQKSSRISITGPLGYLDFLKLMSHARIVFTDSGGIQEETTILRVPCFTMRKNTERPVTIQHGTNTLVGVRGTDILAAYRSFEAKKPSTTCSPPLWDGKAAARILDILQRQWEGRTDRTVAESGVNWLLSRAESGINQ